MLAEVCLQLICDQIATKDHIINKIILILIMGDAGCNIINFDDKTAMLGDA